MTSQTNEQALESAIEKRLTGSCLEELKEAGPGNIKERAPLYRTGKGYYMDFPDDFNANYSIDETRLLK